MACLTFLGLELDSATRIIRLPQDKLARLRQSLSDWGSRKAVRKRELLSLIAAKVVRQGRSFLRRLIDLATVVNHLEQFVRLNIGARSDITWWRTFAHQWNGTSMLYAYSLQRAQLHVYSDASGSWGCAALTGPAWFQLQWPPATGECHISAKEMIPIVIAAILWGKNWQGRSVRFHSDNSAVVALLNSGSVRDDSNASNVVLNICGCIFQLHFLVGTYSGGRERSGRRSLSEQGSIISLSLPSGTETTLISTQSSPGASSRGETGLDITGLDKAVEFYFHHALAPSTQRTYTSAQARYLSFCAQFDITPLPLQETHLCRYVSWLAKDNIAHTTVKSYLSALRHLQIARNLPDPMISTFPKLEGVIRGIKMQQARHKTSSPKRLPITLAHLHKLRSFFASKGNEADSFMLWAAICTCFFGFMRSGEMTIPSESAFDPSSHLCFNDVSVDNIADPQVVKVCLKASKNRSVSPRGPWPNQ